MTGYYKIIILTKHSEDAKTLEEINRRYANKFARNFVNVTVIDDEEAPE